MTQAPEITREIAAIDLGSNSFHMVVARVVGQELQFISRHKERVTLAAGLDAENTLDEAAIKRGLNCLSIFAERIKGFPPQDVTTAATNTLRVATNAQEFLERAKEILPYPIEVIPGSEEARLVYLGVAHTQQKSDSKLVVDIGGGSTELIIGEGFNPRLVTSKPMGCVSYTKAYFSDGKLTPENFETATLAAQQELEALAPEYIKTGWDVAFGSSGTIKAISKVLNETGISNAGISADALRTLVTRICSFKKIEKLELKGLSQDRQPVFAAGVSVLLGVFQALKIEKMHFSEGALREGLLYQMEDSFKRSDIRMRTTEALARKYNIDLQHAEIVKDQARSLLSQVGDQLKLSNHPELIELLDYSALLHEVGLSINLTSVHRHSAYILRHTNLQGFNTEQQKVISTLTRFHRKSLKLNKMEELTLFKKKHILSLIRILRLAVALNGQRQERALPTISLKIQDNTWTLSCRDPQWLHNNKLLYADLLTEQTYWKSLDWKLAF